MPASENWRSTHVGVCVRVRRAVAVAARCTVAWQTAVNTQLKRRGLTSRAPKTSLIQYFRWRNRASEQLLSAEPRHERAHVAERNSEYIASGRRRLPWDFREGVQHGRTERQGLKFSAA